MPAFRSWVDAAESGFGLFKATKAASSFDEIALEPVRTSPCRAVRPGDGAILGRDLPHVRDDGPSKRVPVTHENLIEMARKMERWLELTPADRSACIMPIYYNAGFKATLVGAAADRLQRRPADIDQPARFRSMAGRIAADLAHRGAGVPAGSSSRSCDASSRQHAAPFRCASCCRRRPILPEHTRRELDAPARHAGRGVLRPLRSRHDDRAGAVAGKARLGQSAASPKASLPSATTRRAPLRPGQVGQVMLRGPSVMPGYLLDDIDGMPTRPFRRLAGDRRSRQRRRGGLLTIVGRTKEIINRGGEKIAPYDVEKALLAIPRCARRRHSPCRMRGSARMSAPPSSCIPAPVRPLPQLIDFIYDRLAPFQRPRHIHLVDSLPVGPTGKISRPQLSAAFADAQARPRQPPAAPLEDPDRRDLAAAS